MRALRVHTSLCIALGQHPSSDTKSSSSLPAARVKTLPQGILEPDGTHGDTSVVSLFKSVVSLFKTCGNNSQALEEEKKKVISIQTDKKPALGIFYLPPCAPNIQFRTN